VPRGPWRYDGEIDLGYGGALRMAATVVARDPVFGWIAYGASLGERQRTLAVEPRDGIRRRFAAVVPGPDGGEPVRLKIALERDGFAAGKPIDMDKSLGRIAFIVENRTSDRHTTGLRLSCPAGTGYELLASGQPVALAATGDWDYPWRGEINVKGLSVEIELLRKRER
jgi:hypothetical protein